LLDERSARDNTVIIADFDSKLFMRDIETMTNEESDQWMIECDNHDGSSDSVWREWRVKFEEAEELATFLDFLDDFRHKLYNDNFLAEHTDACGVLQLRPAFKAWAGVEMASSRA